MPWSMPFAEPLGTVAGFVVGEFAGQFAGRVAQDSNLNKEWAKFLATTAGHFVTATVTKAIANIGSGDPIGLGINPVTSFATATVHGAGRVIIDKLHEKEDSTLFEASPEKPLIFESESV